MNDIKDSFICVDKKSACAVREFERGILKGALEYSDYDTFCTPGHKGTLNKADVTEYDGGILFPGDSVEKAQEKARKHYGVKRLYFSVGGSSIAMKWAIWSISGDIVAPVFTHKCVFEGAVLARVDLFTFDNGQSDGLPNIPTPDDYEKAFDEHHSAKVAVVTSPDYFGRCADVEGIAKVCRKRNKLLILDGAHGAHFASSPLLPNGGEQIADFAVMSAHKTLQAYTQSAIGVCNNEKYFDRYDSAVELFGTTSPSYLLLGSIEDAICYEQENGKKYEMLVDVCRRFRKEVTCLNNDDPMRLVVKSKNGKRLFDELINAKIIPETYFGDCVVFIVTLADDVEKIEKLKREIIRIEKDER